MLGTALAMLAGQMLTALVIDVYYERSDRLDALTLGSVALVFGGVVSNEFGGATPSSLRLGAHPDRGQAVAYLLLSALAGAGYAFRSRCSRELARDLGNDVRSTCTLAAITQLVVLPIWTAMWASGSVLPEVDFAADAALWVLCGAQFAAYVYAMTVLPRHMAYTPLFMCVLLGQLTCSTIIDVSGLGDVRVTFTWQRALGLLLVTTGCALNEHRSRTAAARTAPVERAKKAGPDEPGPVDEEQ